MIKLFQENQSCPNCRTEIRGNESSLPVNYYVLKVVDIYKSKSWSESEIVSSIEDIKKKCMERKEILSKFFTSSLEVLDKCLEKLEELTVSERRADAVDVKKILNEVEEDFKKTMVDMLYDDIKSTVSIVLSDFQGSKGYLEEIYKRIYNEEKIFAVRKVEDKIKYGKVSKYESKLFFHSLSLSEVPKDSSLIWFDDLKQCATDTNFYTFLEICCNSKRLTRLAIIKMFDKQQSHHFIKMCTGEYGPSFKEDSFEKGDDSKNFKSVLHIEKCSRLLEYNFSNKNTGFYKCKSNQMFLFKRSAKWNFSIILSKSAVTAGNGIIGKIAVLF
ncbi:hypothetical protein Avbf_15523 [Armadillidium vulgare]|nr:hypothetical protein Avbf_15523 [Armadillidium vulgare]